MGFTHSNVVIGQTCFRYQERRKSVTWQFTLQWKRGKPGIFWPFLFSLWNVSKMVPSVSVRPELLHLYFSVRATSEVFHLVIVFF